MNEIYLDNAATSFPKPESVYQAIDEFMRKGGGSPARGSYVKAQESERKVVRLRSKISQLFGISDPSRMIFTANSTDALNLAIKGWLHEGDHVIATDMEHNAVLRPLWGLRRTRNIDVTIIRSNLKGEIDPDDIFRAITPKTRLICCTHASNVIGTIQPIAEIARRSKEYGIPLLVDASQTAGAIPFNQVEELGIDFFAFTGHKSLLGPTGTGGLYVRQGLELEPFREGGNGAHSEDLEQPKTWPERHESGTPNTVGLVGLLAGIEFLQEKGIASIHEHELQLTRRFMENLQDIKGVIIHGAEAEKKVGITSIGFKSLDTSEAGQILGKKFGIMVRTGIHCAPLAHERLGTKGQGTIRFSVGWANTFEEIEIVTQAIRDIAATIYRRNTCLVTS
jgi:cysteine desulfurase/selenocysteine lyase